MNYVKKFASAYYSHAHLKHVNVIINFISSPWVANFYDWKYFGQCEVMGHWAVIQKLALVKKGSF